MAELQARSADPNAESPETLEVDPLSLRRKYAEGSAPSGSGPMVNPGSTYGSSA